MSAGQVNLPGSEPHPVIPPVQTMRLLSPENNSIIDNNRSQHLFNCMAAGRYPLGVGVPQVPPGIRPELMPFLHGLYGRLNPRLPVMPRPPEEPKPQHSYIRLIATAILSHPDKKLVVSDIYQYFLDNFAYFRARSPGWRNSILHNLSINGCFMKSRRSASRKNRSHYWKIHPAYVDDFRKGDFRRRRRAHTKVRKHKELSVGDSPSPSSPPTWTHHQMAGVGGPLGASKSGSPQGPNLGLSLSPFNISAAVTPNFGVQKCSQQLLNDHHRSSFPSYINSFNRKRQFDVASLLAPEKDSSRMNRLSPSSVKCDTDERNRSHNQSSPKDPTPLGSHKSHLSNKSGDLNASSIDEYDGYCHHRTRLPSDPSLGSSQTMLRFPGPNSSGLWNGEQFLHSHPSMSPHGVISLMDILQAQQIIQLQQANSPGNPRGPQEFQFGPPSWTSTESCASISHAQEVPLTHF